MHVICIILYSTFMMSIYFGAMSKERIYILLSLFVFMIHVWVFKAHSFLETFRDLLEIIRKFPPIFWGFGQKSLLYKDRWEKQLDISSQSLFFSKFDLEFDLSNIYLRILHHRDKYSFCLIAFNIEWVQSAWECNFTVFHVFYLSMYFVDS